MKQKIFILSVACLALTGCSAGHNPQRSNYAVSFSADTGPQFLEAPETQYQAQFKVNVSQWDRNYDTKNCEVFLIVTDKTTPVVGLETDNPNNFAYGGWYNLNVENRALESLGVQPILHDAGANNWFNVVDTTQATARFDVRTKKVVRPNDWRFVILAIRSEQGTDQVLWTKVISPS